MDRDGASEQWTEAERTWELVHTPGAEPELYLRCSGIEVLGGSVDQFRALARAVFRLVGRRDQPPNAGQPWLPEEEAKLRELHAAELGPASIGRELGRTRGAVVARLVQLGLLDDAPGRRRWPG